jgi:hypothetical protein
MTLPSRRLVLRPGVLATLVALSAPAAAPAGPGALRAGEQTAGIRVTARLATSSQSLTVVADVVALGHGRSVASAGFGAFRAPPAAQLERKLTATVACRMQARSA